MALDIRPDPDNAQGGFAVLHLHDPIDAASETVTIKNAFSGQFLGPDGWQPTTFAFGPYPVVSDAGGSRLIVGPEIVNQIEEYTTLDITVGPVQAQTSWPDDVVASPEAAALGGLATVKAETEADQAPVLKAPQTPSEPNTSDEPDTGSPEDDADQDTLSDPTPGTGGEDTSNKTPLMIGLGVLLLAAIAAAVWFFALRETDPEPAPAPPPPAPAAEPSACSLEALQTAAAVSFDTVMEDISTCGSAVSADDAFTILDSAVRQDTAAALLLFGKMYDGSQTDDLIETRIGLTFTGDDTLAAEYYARAASAGAEAAAPLLSETCARLSQSTETLAQTARESYCE